MQHLSLIHIDNEQKTDPVVNLAVEEYALRYLDPQYDYLMLTNNIPSVIMGRNQNPLEEIDFRYLEKQGIRLIRRLSGGGTVYHDPGNLNFSFVTRYDPARLHNFRFFNTPVVEVLRELGVPAYMNDRNDILANGKKISGSAQFSSRGRMISHGTLLFDADLDHLENVLAARPYGVASKSHKSVRSRVANIRSLLSRDMDMDQFRLYMLGGLLKRGLGGSLDDSKKTDDEQQDRTSGKQAPAGVPGGSKLCLQASAWQQIRQIQEQRYESWEWNMGRTPRFEIRRSVSISGNKLHMTAQIQKGIIAHIQFKELSIESEPQTRNTATIRKMIRQLEQDLRQLEQDLTGAQYDYRMIGHLVQNYLRKSSLATDISAEKLLGLLF